MDTGLEALTATDWERLEHYNGEVILEYSHSLHMYTTVDQETGVRTAIPGVTSVIGTLDKSGPLTQWAANETVNWIIANFPCGVVTRQEMSAIYQRLRDKAPWEDLLASGPPCRLECSTEEFTKLLNEARFNYRTISKEACDVGHLAHEWLEGFVKAKIDGTEYSAPMPENPFSQRGIEAALKWFARHNFRPVFAEKKLFSREWGYCGTTDWEAYVTPCDDPECCPHGGSEERFEIGDFKTSRRLYDEYRMQGASYVIASEEEFPERPVDGVRLLHIDKHTAEFESMRLPRSSVEADFHAFLGLLDAYHWQKQIDIDRKYETALAKAESKAEKEAIKAAKAAEKAVKAHKKAAELAEKEAKKALKGAEVVVNAVTGEVKKRRPVKKAVVREVVASIGIEVEGCESGRTTTSTPSFKELMKNYKYEGIPIEGEETAA